MYQVLIDSIKPKSQPTPITLCRNPCMIKSIILGLHPMIILQNKFHLFFKPKAFWMLHLNDHFYSKSCVFLWVVNFRGFTVGFTSLPTLSQAFTVGHICITKINRAFTRSSVYPYLLIPDTYFHLLFPFCLCTLLDVVPPCRAHHQTPNAVLIITMHSHTPMSCDVLVHKCNAMSHCMLYHVTHMMNAI